MKIKKNTIKMYCHQQGMNNMRQRNVNAIMFLLKTRRGKKPIY